MLDLIDPWNANLKLHWKAKIHRGSVSWFDYSYLDCAGAQEDDFDKD